MEVLIHTLTSALDESGQLHVPEALPPREKPPYPSARIPGGPQSRSGHRGEVKKNLLYL
jgi:hypothetical protein